MPRWTGWIRWRKTWIPLSSSPPERWSTTTACRDKRTFMSHVEAFMSHAEAFMSHVEAFVSHAEAFMSQAEAFEVHTGGEWHLERRRIRRRRHTRRAAA